MKITHLGGPTTLIELEGWRILTDPTFDPPGRTYSMGLGLSSTKLAGAAATIEEILPIDLILLSHDHHADNLDAKGREVLGRAAYVLTTTPGQRRLKASNVVGLDDWQATTVTVPGRDPLLVTATPARHGPPLSRALTGKVNGFAVSLSGPEKADLWMSGDTVLYDGVRSVGRRMDVDVALLHLGGVGFGLSGPIRYSMTARQAISLVEEMQPRVAVPVHYEGWSHFQESTAAMSAGLAAATPAVANRFHQLEIGVPATL